MPSAKPDKSEVAYRRKKRGLFQNPPNLFSELFLHCGAAVKGGYITESRAKKLRDYLEAQGTVSRIFPNSILLEALQSAARGWDYKHEAKLLDILFGLYVGDPTEVQVPVGVSLRQGSESGVAVGTITEDCDPEEIKPPSEACDFLKDFVNRNPDLYLRIFNDMQERLQLEDRFFSFTGPFENQSRRGCFEQVRARGGVPCDVMPYCDYLFVSDKHVRDRVLLSSLLEAICHRRVGGKPLILKEADWCYAVS